MKSFTLHQSKGRWSVQRRLLTNSIKWYSEKRKKYLQIGNYGYRFQQYCPALFQQYCPALFQQYCSALFQQYCADNIMWSNTVMVVVQGCQLGCCHHTHVAEMVSLGKILQHQGMKNVQRSSMMKFCQFFSIFQQSPLSQLLLRQCVQESLVWAMELAFSLFFQFVVHTFSEVFGISPAVLVCSIVDNWCPFFLQHLWVTIAGSTTPPKMIGYWLNPWS